MSWEIKCEVELRLEFVKRVMQGESISSLSREFCITRRTGYKWVNRFKESMKVNSLYNKSRKPQNCPHQTAEEEEDRVCELRELYGWGARKLCVLLKREGIDLPAVTVNRIIKRNNLLIMEDCHKPAPLRFEREFPNELWQGDFKGPMGRGDARCEPLSIVDDHSRFVLALNPVKSKQTKEIKRAFQEVFEEYGVPEALLLDHGVPWWATAHYKGFSQFSVWLMRQDLRLIFSGINHPQTQGKVERFHKALAASVRTKGTPLYFHQWKDLLATIKEEFNTVRPHEALDMEVPATRYVKSTKPFNPKPRPIEYPQGASVVRLDSLGRFRHKNIRVFVSQALAREYVRLEELASSTLVYYRNTIVREILATGKSYPVYPPGSWSHKPAFANS